MEIDDRSLIEVNINNALVNGLAAFDGLGKELKKRLKDSLSNTPRNLFQKIDVLSKMLLKKYDFDLEESIADFSFLFKMFQVRHIIEHNMGVVDDDFIKKLPQLRHMLGKKYPLTKQEVQMFLDSLTRLTKVIEAELDDYLK